MNSTIIVHGKPTRERYENPALAKPHEANWLPWLGRQLVLRGIPAAIPAFPRPYYPTYSAWKAVFEGTLVTEQTGLVGHSAGADFILRLLSENKKNSVERIALVAPWHDAAGKYGDFSHYSLDEALTERVEKVSIYTSLDDSVAIQDNAHRLARLLPTAKLVELDGFGHFMLGNNMASEEFPELLADLLE